MNEAALLEFIARPEPERFEPLAEDRLRAWTESETSGAGGPLAPSSPLSWRTADAVRVDTREPSIPLPADGRILDAVAQAQWRHLAREPGTPLLLLLAPEEPADTRLAKAIRQGTPDQELLHPVASGRIDRLRIRSWLAGRQRAGQPAWIVASESAARELLYDLDRRRLLFRLPPGSRVVRLGTPESLLEPSGCSPGDIATRLGVPLPDQAVLLIQSTLSSVLPAAVAESRECVLAPPPPWMRYRVIDRPEDQRTQLAVFDLATTRLPPLQILDWPITGKAGGIRLHSGS